MQIRESRFQIAEHKVQIPDSRVQIPDYRVQSSDSRLQIPKFRFRIAEPKVQIPDSRVQIPDCRFQSPDSRLQIPKSRFQIADSKVQIPDCRFESPDVGLVPTPQLTSTCNEKATPATKQETKSSIPKKPIFRILPIRHSLTIIIHKFRLFCIDLTHHPIGVRDLFPAIVASFVQNEGLRSPRWVRSRNFREPTSPPWVRSRNFREPTSPPWVRSPGILIERPGQGIQPIPPTRPHSPTITIHPIAKEAFYKTSRLLVCLKSGKWQIGPAFFRQSYAGAAVARKSEIGDNRTEWA